MLEAGVKVDTPLKDGNMLMAAVYRQWTGLALRLVIMGTDLSMGFANLGDGRTAVYDDALEAFLRCRPDERRAQFDLLARLLIDEHRVPVSARHVGAACESKRHALVQRLLGHHPDLNETYTLHGKPTSALIEAVRSGSESNARLLIKHKADVNLQVGGFYGDAISAAFLTSLPWFWEAFDIALAAAAHAGLEDIVQECFKLGADPNAFCDHDYTTALGAAAASDHPRALNIVRILLDNGADINAYFPITSKLWTVRDRVALDFPLHKMLKAFSEEETEADCNQRLDTWLRMAETLVSKGAIWDIDFAQWRKCLEKKAPEFFRKDIESLDRLLQKLKSNRSSCLQNELEATRNGQWGIKDIGLGVYSWKRSILYEMVKILR